MNKKWKGQGLVEFALLLPVLLLIVLGIVEAALVIQGYIGVQHAAREATRFAVSYQPVQGACIDKDRDGMLMDGIAPDDGADAAPYPACPVDNAGWAEEPLEHYQERRVKLIKQMAYDSAVGLRIDPNYYADTPTKYETFKDEPGFFGVLVWGFPSWETDCDANPSLCEDHPGLEGLPIRVVVAHNVEVIDPLYQAIADYVSVFGDSTMDNEGQQVGKGDSPLPHMDTNPHFGEPEGETPESTPEEETTTPTVEPTLPPGTYYVTLYPDAATNELPDDRSHQFFATVTNQLGEPVNNARVNFFTDYGAFGASGVEPYAVEELTNALGQASVTVYGNEPGSATIYAWLDLNGNDVRDGGEPSDSAVKTWEVTGPYITVSSHEVYPFDYIAINVLDHTQADNPHRLLWCTISGTNTSAVVQDPVEVDVDGDLTGIGFEIPEYSHGTYRLETHSEAGGCGELTDLVAYSGEIIALISRPDLHIASINLPDPICPQTLFTATVVVENLTPARINDIFDVDFFVDPPYTPPHNPIGHVKQWITTMDPYGTTTVNAVLWVEEPGAHEIWVRVDTTNFIDEEDEENNVDDVAFTTGALGGEVQDTGWRSPSADAPTSHGDGDGFEDDPEDAYSNGGGAAANWNGRYDRHVYSNYGIDLDDACTVEGIEVRLDGWSRWGGSNHRYRVWLSWDGGNNWSDRRTTNGLNSYQTTMVEGGSSDEWGHNWTPEQLSDGNFQVMVQSRSNSNWQDFFLDWIPVRVYYSCPAECTIGTDDPPWGEDAGKPPGLTECQELVTLGTFEGSDSRIGLYWDWGQTPADSQHQSMRAAGGAWSMRLNASLGSYPNCPALNPWLVQEVTLPTEVYAQTEMVVRGKRLVNPSSAPCSYPDANEADDVLYLQMKNAGGDLGSAKTVVHGGAAANWNAFALDVTDDVDLQSRAGQQVKIHFYATHDADFNDTWFYLDDVSCDTCTTWAIPEPEAGMSAIGGDVTVIVNNIPQKMQGIDVWAYAQGGQVYHTTTIQDYTYGFYNVPPGTYTIYAETWVESSLYYAITTVTVGADEANMNVDLTL